MTGFIKINGNFINSNRVRLVEFSDDEYPIAIVHWTTGRKQIFKRNAAKEIFKWLNMAASSDSTTT